jgi:hypothetical protein
MGLAGTVRVGQEAAHQRTRAPVTCASSATLPVVAIDRNRASRRLSDDASSL